MISFFFICDFHRKNIVGLKIGFHRISQRREVSTPSITITSMLGKCLNNARKSNHYKVFAIHEKIKNGVKILTIVFFSSSYVSSSSRFRLHVLKKN